MRKTAPSHGRSLFPTPSGGRRFNNRIGITPFRRCVQCGRPNDTRKTAWSRQGDGLDANGDAKSGCNFCGSLFWQPQKPRKLEDDRFKADPDVKRRR